MVMTLYAFRLLSHFEQSDLLYRDGTYIGKRKYGRFTALLYQFDSFYVEVIYKKYRSHIRQLRCFQTTLLLTPYLDQINVEELVRCL